MLKQLEQTHQSRYVGTGTSVPQPLSLSQRYFPLPRHASGAPSLPPPLVTSSLRLMVLTYLSRDPPDVLAAATPTTVPMEFYTKRVIDVATVRAS